MRSRKRSKDWGWTRMPRRTVDDVLAHAGYDPVARRERYLRERQLKGRHRLVANPPKAGQGSRVVDANAPGSTVHTRAPNLVSAANQAASNARQVAALKSRLASLHAALEKLLAEAKAKSSSSSSTTKSKALSVTPVQKRPKTAAQKAAAKKALDKARQVEKSKAAATPNKPATTTTATTRTPEQQIAHIRAVISDVEAKLRAALEKARTQTASSGR